MSLSDNYDIFPVLKTKRIILTENNISVKFSLSTRDKTNESSWIGISKFKDLIKVFFLLVPGRQKKDLLGLSNPETRFFTINPGTQRRVAGPNDGSDPHGTLAHLKSSFVHKIVSFSEIFNSDYTTEVSELNEIYNLSTVNDINYEIDIDTHEVDFESDDTWYLYSFIHLDFGAIVEGDTDHAFNLFNAASTRVFAAIGGNSTYDTLLKRNSQRKLIAPTTVNIFYLPPPDGSPYFGPFHYHGPENPGPDGYVGYMAGYSDGEMGTKLDVKKERNNKVIAKNFIDDTGFMSGYFGGELYSFESLDQEGSSSGSSLEKAISLISSAKEKMLGFSRLTDAKRNARKRACLHYAKLNQANILISAAESGISVNRSQPSSQHHHYLVFAINYADLLTINSPLGWLYEYHATPIARNGAEFMSYNVLNAFIQSSGHKQMIIKRKRLTNAPLAANRCSVSDYELYKYQPDFKNIIICGDNTPYSRVYGDPAINYNSDDNTANITEMNLEAEIDTIEELSEALSRFFYNPYRYFYVEDYDLFRNVNFGNYTYDIELSIVDGIKYTVERMYVNFKIQLTKFMEYYNFASIPHNDDPYTQKETNGEFWVRSQADVQPGSFDFINNKYTEQFRTTAIEKYSKAVEDLIVAFRACYCIVNNDLFAYGGITEDVDLLTTESIFGEENEWNQMRAFIHPETVQPGSLDVFLSMCKEMENTFKNLLGYSKTRIPIGAKTFDDGRPTTYHAYDAQSLADGLINTRTINSSDRVKGASYQTTDDIINVSANIPVVSTALQGTEILYEPISSNEYQQSSPPVIRDTPIAQSRPGDFFKVNDIHSDDTPSTVSIIPAGSSRYSSAMGAITQAIYGQANRHGTLEPSMPVHSEALVNYSSTLSGIGGVTISFGLTGALGRVRQESEENRSAKPTSERGDLELTKELEEAICSAALLESDKNKFIENVSSTYEDLVLGIDSLGSLWEEVQSLAHGLEFADSAEISTTATDWQSIANNGNQSYALETDNQVSYAVRNAYQDNNMELRRLVPGRADSVSPNDAPDLERGGGLFVYKQAQNTPDTGIIVNNLFFTPEAMQSSRPSNTTIGQVGSTTQGGASSSGTSGTGASSASGGGYS